MLPDETDATCAGFLERAADYLAAKGMTRIERVMTDNAMAYRNSHAVKAVLQRLGAKHKLIKPHCPCQNGKVERFKRTLATDWAYRTLFTSSEDRTDALAPWLERYSTGRCYNALGGETPLTRLSPT